MKTPIYPIFVALALTGCVSGPVSSKLSDSHPANPQAMASPQAPATPMLMAGSQGLVLPLSTNQTEMKYEEHQHKATTKDVQQPAEHKHEKEEKK